MSDAIDIVNIYLSTVLMLYLVPLKVSKQLTLVAISGNELNGKYSSAILGDWPL